MITGCTTRMHPGQLKEYRLMEKEKVLIEEKSPVLGGFLGMVGLASFYSDEPGHGFVGLISWPYSMMWEIKNGTDGARIINYNVTKHNLRNIKKTELKQIGNQLLNNEINTSEYLELKEKLDEKYDYRTNTGKIDEKL